MQQTDLIESQKLIEKLDGVLAAKLTCDAQGNLTEIHILANRSRPPKQLSRDIQSAVAASTGVDVEHKIISIAQIGEETFKSDERLKINSIEVTNSVDGFQATVALTLDSKIYKGSASGSSGQSGIRFTLARACINALHDFISVSAFYVSDVLKVHIANLDEINVAVSYTDRGMERLLTGTALVRDDEYQAVVRATLDAVNRVLFNFIS